MTRIFAVFAITLQSGCAYLFEDAYKGWVGRDITEFQSAYRDREPREIRGPDERGHRFYVYDLTGLGNCTVTWDVDETGRIVAWNHEGPDCSLTFP